MNALTNALIAFGAVGVVGYALMTHLQNRAPRTRTRAGEDGGADSYSDTTNDSISLGSWFSSDSSGSSTDSSSCSASDSGGSGGDCGGGGDGGGGGSSD
jgi:hypothetical protein